MAKDSPRTDDRTGMLRLASRLLALLLVLTAAGCQSVGSVGPLARWRMARDATLAKGPTRTELGDTRGMMARWLTPRAAPASDPNPESTLVLGSDGWRPAAKVSDPEAEKELAEADDLLKQGKAPEAERALARIAKKRKGTIWGEKAQFQLAESQYRRGKLTAAKESYAKLMTDYIGTRYDETVSRREFEIADTWLVASDPAAKPDSKRSFLARFDGKVPLFDASGHALQALDHARHHDVDGPLADDAVMRIADYHYAIGNWEDASSYYDQLLSDHPKSPFARRAHLASIDAKIKNYRGPDYDSTGLLDARDMIKKHLQMYPERQTSQSDTLYKTLDLIHDQEAEQAYKIGEFYLRTGKVNAAEYYFGEIPVKYPDSTWARQAKQRLAEVRTMPRAITEPSKMMSRPGSTDPLINGSGGMGGMGSNSGSTSSPGGALVQ